MTHRCNAVSNAGCVLHVSWGTQWLPFLVSAFYNRMSSDDLPLCMSSVPFSDMVIVLFLMPIKTGVSEKGLVSLRPFCVKGDASDTCRQQLATPDCPH